MSTKFAVITFSTGNHPDTLKSPTILTNDTEYICVTDNKYLTHNIWHCIYDDTLLQYASPRDRMAVIKYNPFKYTACKLAITIDATFLIQRDLSSIFTRLETYDIGIKTHPVRHKLIDELDVWKNVRHLPISTYNKFHTLLKLSNYNPQYNGLYETSIILWKNTSLCSEIMYHVLHLMKLLGTNADMCISNQIPFTYIINKYFQFINPMYFRGIQGIERYFHNGHANPEVPKSSTYVLDQMVKSPLI